MSHAYPLEKGQIAFHRDDQILLATNFTYTPSPRRIEQVVSVQLDFRAAAAGPDREVRIVVSDATGQIQIVGSNQRTPQAGVSIWQYIENVGLFTDVPTEYGFWPTNLIIPLGGTLTSDIVNLAFPDTLRDLRIVLQTWTRT